MMMLKEIAEKISKAGKIAILPHISADGDALGSCLALGLALRKAGKDVAVFSEEEVPAVYGFLPGLDMLKVYKSGGCEAEETVSGCKSGKDECSMDIMPFDLVIALDTGDMDRLGKRAALFNSTENTVNIDHHTTNTGFASINYVDMHASAVGEIIYRLVEIMGISLDRDISTCLYVAISTDTGGFRYSNTTSDTHRIAANLVDRSIDVAAISQRVFDSTSLPKVRLMGEVINSLELLQDGKVAFCAVTREMLERSGAKEEDCDGLVNIGRNIEGVEVSVLLKKLDHKLVKANLRSKEYVDVAAIANIFNGGGHKRAAGFTFEGQIDDIKNRILDKIGEVLK